MDLLIPRVLFSGKFPQRGLVKSPAEVKEVRQRKTNTVYHLYVDSKKYNKLVNITKKKQTHR